MDYKEYNDLTLNYLHQPYLRINKESIKLFGAKRAALLSGLIDWRNHLEREKKLSKNNYFYIEQKILEESCGIGLRSQIRYIHFFKKLGILEVKRKGIPSKNWYYIDLLQLTKILKTGALNIYEKSNKTNCHNGHNGHQRCDETVGSDKNR